MSLKDALADPDAVIVAVGPAGQTGDVLQVRVSQGASAEFADLLRKAQILKGVVIQESAEIQQLTPFIASIAGGLGGLAAVLRTWFQRHQHQSIAFTYQGERFELRGMSQTEMDELITRILAAAETEQRRRDQEYPDIQS